MSTWSHLTYEKAFGPQKLTEFLNWTVQHLRNRNILFHSDKRAYWCQNVLPYQLSSWRMSLHKSSTRRVPTKLVRQTNWKFAETSNETWWYMSWNIPLNMWACQLSRCHPWHLRSRRSAASQMRRLLQRWTTSSFLLFTILEIKLTFSKSILHYMHG